ITSAVSPPLIYLFFFLHPSPTVLYTLSLHDALPICPPRTLTPRATSPTTSQAAWRSSPKTTTSSAASSSASCAAWDSRPVRPPRSEEHTSELQSRGHLVCRLLLEKKK